MFNRCVTVWKIKIKKKNGTNSAKKELNHPESLALSF